MKLISLFLALTVFVVDSKNISSKWNIKQSDLIADCKVPNAFVAYTEGIVAVSWIPVDSSCSPEPIYKIQYKIDDHLAEMGDPIDSDTPMALLPFKKLRCERIAARVVVMENETIVGQSVEKQLKRVLDDITQLSITKSRDGLQVTWKPLYLGESCHVTYSIEYTVDDINKKQNDLENPRFTIPLTNETPCTLYNVKVIANSNKLKSKPAEISYEIAIAPVRDVVLRDYDGVVKVDFKPSVSIPAECGEVDYRVIQNDKLCFRSDVLIVPVSGRGYEGVATKKTIIRRPGAVQALEADPKDDKVYIGWKTPIDAADCNIIYFVKINEETFNVRTTHYVATMQLEACIIEEIQVTPAIVVGYEFVEGQTAYLELAGDVGEVDDIKCVHKPNFVECWWRKPLDATNCRKLMYDITYFDGNGKKNNKTYDTTFTFAITNTTCNFWFAVQPIAYIGDKMYEGDIIEAVIEGIKKVVRVIQLIQDE